MLAPDLVGCKHQQNTTNMDSTFLRSPMRNSFFWWLLLAPTIVACSDLSIVQKTTWVR